MRVFSICACLGKVMAWKAVVNGLMLQTCSWINEREQLYFPLSAHKPPPLSHWQLNSVPHCVRSSKSRLRGLQNISFICGFFAVVIANSYPSKWASPLPENIVSSSFYSGTFHLIIPWQNIIFYFYLFLVKISKQASPAASPWLAWAHSSRTYLHVYCPSYSLRHDVSYCLWIPVPVTYPGA